MRNALIVGISGSIGQALLENLLNNRHYKKVVILTRRESRRFKNIHIQSVLVDFSRLDDFKYAFDGIDDVFCLLGKEFISTVGLSDADQFEYDVPLKIAQLANEAGVKNFFLLNHSKANIHSDNPNFKLRAQLQHEIEKLPFTKLHVFKVNGISSSVGVENAGYQFKKSFGGVLNKIGLGFYDKFLTTPANILAEKMVFTAVNEPEARREFLPKDI
jgi:hypothetical protein